MTSRLDDIFDPGKLRRNWQTKGLPAAGSAQLTLNLEIRNHYRGLLRLVEETFPDSSNRLAVNFVELQLLFELAYPLDAEAKPANGKQKQVLVDKLEQLEELLWALKLMEDNPE